MDKPLGVWGQRPWEIFLARLAHIETDLVIRVLNFIESVAVFLNSEKIL